MRNNKNKDTIRIEWRHHENITCWGILYEDVMVIQNDRNTDPIPDVFPHNVGNHVGWNDTCYISTRKNVGITKISPTVTTNFPSHVYIYMI